MQAKEDPSSARCRSSTDDASLPFPVESKGVDFRRIRHGLDPRYSVYRWDCGSYPYFKAPVPTSAAPCPGVQSAFASNNLGYPSHVPTAQDIFCDGRGDCYGGVVVGSSGQDFVPQPQRCICPDTHDPRYHPQHLGSDALTWEQRSAGGGCLCCGQHMSSNPHGPRRSNHHPPTRHLDSSGRLFQPVYRTVVAGPDVVHVYPPSRKSIDASWPEGSAPGAQCLPSSSSSETLCIGSGLGDQRPELRRDDCAVLQLMEDKISSTSAIKPYNESVSTENRDARRSNGGPGRETGASLVERFGSVTTDPEDKIATAVTMKNIGSVTTEEPNRSDLTTGKISDAKITPTRSSSKVTPLYGLPSWWGDEPISDFDQKRKYSHPTVTSSSSSSESPTQKKQTERSDRVPIAKTRTSLSNSYPPDATTNGGSLGPTAIPTAAGYSQNPITNRVDVHGFKHSQSNKDLGHYPIIFENPGLQKTDSRSLRNQESQGSLGTFEMSTTFSNCSPDDFESPISSVSRSLQICGHHSPPERDRPSSTVDGDAPPPPLQHFLYPDPLLPLPVRRDIRLVTCGDDCGPLKCKAPTAFIVDLQEMDNDNDDDNEDNTQRRSITVKTSLRQFLPRRCERSLQRRLSWMKQNRKPHSATERGEGSRTEQTSGGDMVGTTDPRQRFRLSLQRSGSFKDSFEEAVASDAIADDVSEAGTYTIDVSSDGESVAVADARERILATFGITGIEDDELEQGEWAESGKGYFEKDSDRDSSKKDVSLKSKTNRKPATLKFDNNTVINDSRSNATEPVTPTAESYAWSFSEAFSPPPLPSKNDLPAQDDIVLTIYTESPAGCSITRSGDQPESHRMISHQDVQGPPQRPRCLDTSVLLTETERSTLDAGQVLLEPGTMSPSCCTSTMPRHSGDETCFSLGSNKAGPFLFSTSTVASESGRIILPTDRDYFRIPASSYSGPVSSLQFGVVPAAGILPDAEMLDPGLALRRKPSAASASGDSLESPGRMTTTASGKALSADDQMSESGTNSNSKSLLCGLLCGPEKDKDGAIRTGSNGPQKSNTVGHNSCGNSIDYKSDSDEDGSSVDPLNVQVSVRTVTSSTTEVSLKPTVELAQVNLIVGQKSRTTRKSVEEKCHHQMNDQTTTTTTKTMTAKVVESESPAKHAEIRDKKPRTSNTGGPKTQINSPNTDKSPASRHPKTKPPTPKSFPKSPSFPDGQLASRRCFSDLDVAGHDDASSEATASPLASEGKGIGGKGATTSSVEHTRMNRTFALRCARREASDGTEANRSDNNPQRSARTTKKTSGSSSSSKFDDAQRSRSASRSRPGGVSSRSLFESSRSADTSLNLGQRTAKKGQEIDRKTRQTSTTDTMSRSLTRDDDSSSQKSAAAAAAAFRPPNAIKTTKKKSLASERGKEDTSSEGGSGGATVKGSPVQSRPLSSSMTVPEAAGAGNEWTRRKKYNPRQSLQTEVSAKKTTGKPDGKPVPGNVDKAEAKPRNRKKVAEAGGKNTTPSTPSDWTDDEKLQLTPRGRDLPAVCQLSAKVKLLSDQVLQTLRKRPEFKVNEIVLQSPKQASSDTDSLENTSPEFLYIFHNLEAAERQMSAVFKVLSTHN